MRVREGCNNSRLYPVRQGPQAWPEECGARTNVMLRRGVPTEAPSHAFVCQRHSAAR